MSTRDSRRRFCRERVGVRNCCMYMLAALLLLLSEVGATAAVAYDTIPNQYSRRTGDKPVYQDDERRRGCCHPIIPSLLGGEVELTVGFCPCNLLPRLSFWNQSRQQQQQQQQHHTAVTHVLWSGLPAYKYWSVLYTPFTCNSSYQ